MLDLGVVHADPHVPFSASRHNLMASSLSVEQHRSVSGPSQAIQRLVDR